MQALFGISKPVLALLLVWHIAPELTLANDATKRFAAAADAFKKGDAVSRERWIVELLDKRSEPACRVFMDEKALQAEIARHKAVISAVREGRQLSDSGLYKILAEVDRQETTAIERLEVELRQGSSAAEDPTRARQRLVVWGEILADFNKLGRPWIKQYRLVGWLQRQVAEQNGADQRVELSADEKRSSTAKLKGSSKSSAKYQEPPELQIDVKELGARIRGYNMAVSKLVSQLQAQDEWRIGQLESVTQNLSELTIRRADLELYRNLLPSETQSKVRPLENLDGAIAMVASRVWVARKRVEQAPADFAGIPSQTDLLRLDQVSRRLAEMAPKSK